MGMLEDVSRVEVLKERVDQLTHQVTCIHNRVEEFGDSSVRAHERVSELDQKLRAEIASIRDQAQRWSGVRSWNEACILHDLQSFRNRASKIEERLAPTCADATVQKVSTTPVLVTVRCRSGCHPVYSRVGHGDWKPVPASVAMTPPDLLTRHQFFVDGVLHEVFDIVNEHEVPEPQHSTTPGTWAWACEQMLAGKKVCRAGSSWIHSVSEGSCIRMRDQRNKRQDAFITYDDLTATDWKVVS